MFLSFYLKAFVGISMKQEDGIMTLDLILTIESWSSGQMRLNSVVFLWCYTRTAYTSGSGTGNRFDHLPKITKWNEFECCRMFSTRKPTATFKFIPLSDFFTCSKKLQYLIKIIYAFHHKKTGEKALQCTATCFCQHLGHTSFDET